MTRRLAWAALATGLAALAVSGCARKEPARPPAQVPPPVVVPPAPPAVPGPRSYVTVASSIDRMMIRASELAQARARDPALRELAAQIGRDHLSISAQLSFAGRRLNQLPSGRLMNNHLQRLAALDASPDFDSAYRSEMVRSLAAALEYHRRYAEKGASPTLRPVARYAADLIARNLATLKGLS